jgi:hypothetical protein
MTGKTSKRYAYVHASANEHLISASADWRINYVGMQMVLPKAQVEDNADATIVRAQLHLQELQVVDVDRICKQVWEFAGL